MSIDPNSQLSVGSQNSPEARRLPVSLVNELTRYLSSAAVTRPKAPTLPPLETATILKTRLSLFDVEHSFARGQLVRWKAGLKNRKKPDDGQPAIVMDVLAASLIDKIDNAGSPFFQEPLDLVLGVLHDDGSFMVFHYDKRRFEPFA